MGNAIKSKQPTLGICTDHNKPICGKCGYCVADPEHKKQCGNAIGRTKRAKMRQSDRYVSYLAHVVGVLWSSCPGETDYQFDHLPTQAEIDAKAGDFGRVKSIRVVRKTVIFEEVSL